MTPYVGVFWGRRGAQLPRMRLFFKFYFSFDRALIFTGLPLAYVGNNKEKCSMNLFGHIYIGIVEVCAMYMV